MWPQVQDIENINHIYPFKKFNTKLIEIDRLLNKGGVLVIFNSNFLFEETSVYENYTNIELFLKEDQEIVQIFNKLGDRIEQIDYHFYYKK